MGAKKTRAGRGARVGLRWAGSGSNPAHDRIVPKLRLVALGKMRRKREKNPRNKRGQVVLGQSPLMVQRWELYRISGLSASGKNREAERKKKPAR